MELGCSKLCMLEDFKYYKIFAFKFGCKLIMWMFFFFLFGLDTLLASNVLSVCIWQTLEKWLLWRKPTQQTAQMWASASGRRENWMSRADRVFLYLVPTSHTLTAVRTINSRLSAGTEQTDCVGVKGYYGGYLQIPLCVRLVHFAVLSLWCFLLVQQKIIL